MFSSMNRILCLYKKGIFGSSLSSKFGRALSTKSFIPFHEIFFQYADNVAVVDNHGSYKYRDILHSSYFLAKKIKTHFPNSGERISFLCSNDATYVSVLLACWITGNIAVPLCSKHPQSLLEYYVEDSQSRLLITNKKYLDTIENIASKFELPHFVADRDILTIPSAPSQNELSGSKFFTSDTNFGNDRALIIYTSGTTGKPKGVVLNHGTLHAQTSAIIKGWEVTQEDSIFHSLPLHHIHGIMNALLVLLRAGGTVVMQEKFDAVEAWKYFLNLNNRPRVNLFFAVPTMYAKLVQEFEKVSEIESFAKKQCLKNMRLFCSGSASLPIPVFHGMETLTGHRMIERFGMSEVGMALSTQVNGPREPGTVGVPMPAVEIAVRKHGEGSSFVDLVYGNDKEVKILSGKEGDAGELLVKGPNVFSEYWNKEKATIESFTEDGWFLTGDTVCYENGAFKILGRTSVDIIKSGGYKISALDVESCLLRHPEIVECTVFGLPDEVWGERVACLVLTKQGKSIKEDELKSFCKQFIPPYATPTVIKFVDEIPRNVMGKVNKKEVRAKYSAK